MRNNNEPHITSSDIIQKFADIMAISVSTLCFFHCLIAPVTLIFLPILGANVLNNEYFHKFMIFLVLPSTAVAVSVGCKRHKDALVLLLGVIGFMLLLSGVFIANAVAGDYGEIIFTTAGGLMLVSGHIRNFMLCREDYCEHNIFSGNEGN